MENPEDTGPAYVFESIPGTRKKLRSGSFLRSSDVCLQGMDRRAGGRTASDRGPTLHKLQRIICHSCQERKKEKKKEQSGKGKEILPTSHPLFADF